MNNDINLIYEQYKQQVLLNELDLGADYGAVGPAIAKGVKEREATHDTYLFKIIKTALNKSSDEVADILAKPLYDILFPNGRFAAKGEQKDQLAKLQSTIQAKMPEIVSMLQQSYPELSKAKGIGSSAIHGYTARILKGFIAPVVQNLEAEASGDDVPSEPEVQAAVKKTVQQKATEPIPGGETPAPEESKDKTSVRIEHMIAELVDDTGVLEADVLNDVERKIMSSGGLGIDEKRIKPTVKMILGNLVKKKILERKGSYLKLGDNFEQFEAAGSQGSEVISDDELIQQYTGLGARPTTARDTWSRGGDSSMFG